MTGRHLRPAALVRLDRRDDGAPTATWTYDLLDQDGATTVVQRFQHGPGTSFLSARCDRRPEEAEVYVSGRAADLEANMRTVLHAAAARLAVGSG